MKKSIIHILVVMLVFGFTLPAMAQEEPAATGNEAAFDDTAERLQGVAQNRGFYIADILAAWGADPNVAEQLELSLMVADDDQILAASEASSLEEVNAILLGAPVASGELVGPAALGSTSGDLTFTPVTPCRIIDTRLAGGPLTGGATREFFVYGNLGASQGGTNCASPVGEPSGAHLAVTVIPLVAGGGNLRLYPANVATPNAAIINYTNPTTIANAVTTKTFRSIGPREIEFWTNKSVHIIVDVMGYYSPPGRTLPDNYSAHGTIVTVNNGANGTAYSPYCPSGYRMTGGGHLVNVFVNGFDIVGQRPTPTGYNQNSRWLVQVRNASGAARTIRSYIVCGRVPGR